MTISKVFWVGAAIVANALNVYVIFFVPGAFSSLTCLVACAVGLLAGMELAK
jgi:hypothetical protein